VTGTGYMSRVACVALEFRVLSPWSRCLQEQVKLEDEFDFELSIYPDRFLQRSLVFSLCFSCTQISSIHNFLYDFEIV